MIKSMTGFGKGEKKDRSGNIKVEIRSVNHKFLEIGIRLPEGLSNFEDRVREVVSSRVKRGKVNVNLIYEDRRESAEKIVVDVKLAKAYYGMLAALKKKIPLEGSIRLDQLITLPGVITYEPRGAVSNKIWAAVEGAVRAALAGLDKSRFKEGRAIYADLYKRIGYIEEAIDVIKQRSKVNARMYRDRMKENIKEYSGGAVGTPDKVRLEQEVALYIKNSDITEEVTRVAAHVKSLRDSLKSELELGKKLDFIAQELNREVNTIGSKAGDFKIAQKVIQIKSEVEKLREQAKNIE